MSRRYSIPRHASPVLTPTSPGPSRPHQRMTFSRFLHSIRNTPPHYPLFIFLTLLLAASLVSRPDPTSRSFQFPSLLPSSYPPPIRPSDPQLANILDTTYQSFLDHCPRGIRYEPVHLVPTLSIAQERRYAHLRDIASRKGVYMIVATLRQIAAQLPDLLNTIVVLVDYLGADSLAFSILEGPSDDCTPDVLESTLRPLLISLGIPSSRVHLSTREGKIDFNNGNRIEILAGLRNRAMEPIWKGGEKVAAVVAINDVYLKASDVLELLHWHFNSGAAITTGMDWWKKRPEYYYDVWVGRSMSGDLFYPIDQTWWTPSDNLFETHQPSRDAYSQLRPFQVYASWNGMAILAPEPFLPPHNVRFRRGVEEIGECAASECGLLAQDYWKVGYGRVLVVPSVQLGYERDVALDIIEDLDKQLLDLGWKDGVPPKSLDKPITFDQKPPEKIRCHPWPEENGLGKNVWGTKVWVGPLDGLEDLRDAWR
ncbi:cryptococcal mannosyltransferase 1-domain-containing protein [Naematelia encephala]|uniref:Cryptococcal mannosyltransferase 1-domain-containing protein n=1 Tax=Naematelia encephala TaxID=71784 RepID=A0A1Y2BIT8_9TREE|nr:cryptococcal mannosyltransferase 1-domain-containing protein [Naematelia encephala]